MQVSIIIKYPFISEGKTRSPGVENELRFRSRGPCDLGKMARGKRGNTINNKMPPGRIKEERNETTEKNVQNNCISILLYRNVIV